MSLSFQFVTVPFSWAIHTLLSTENQSGQDSSAFELSDIPTPVKPREVTMGSPGTKRVNRMDS